MSPAKTSAGKSAAAATIERSALLAAQERFLAWREQWLSTTPDRLAFNRLQKAVAELQTALGGFASGHEHEHPCTVNRAALLHGLQALGPAVRPQADHAARLDDLVLLLGGLSSVAGTYAGRGVQASPGVRQWVWIAADQWVHTIGREPGAAERGRFWQALSSLQGDKAQASKYLPQLNHASMRAAMTHWTSRRAVTGEVHASPD